MRRPAVWRKYRTVDPVGVSREIGMGMPSAKGIKGAFEVLKPRAQYLCSIHIGSTDLD